MPKVKRTAGKTGNLYSALNAGHFTKGEKTDNLISKLAVGADIGNESLFNVFEQVAYTIYDGLDKCRDDFLAAGAASVHLAGSGPTLFTMQKNKDDAFQICDRLKENGYQAEAVKTLGINDLLSAETAV
jgi:4-diphosphocytidyl-2-C-methyl-D-erythritol kinase